MTVLFSNMNVCLQEGIEILLESYARIQHLVSQHWLHLEKKGIHYDIR